MMDTASVVHPAEACSSPNEERANGTMKTYKVFIDAENEEELKFFLSAGLEGLTNCKVRLWVEAR